MIRILDIALKDLSQLLRERETFLFFLAMPLVLTFLFGYAAGGFSGSTDSRLPVGFLNEDGSHLSRRYYDLLVTSQVIRLVEYPLLDRADLEALVADEKMAAALVIPPGYGRGLLHDKRSRLALIGNTGSTAGNSIQSEVLTRAIRLESAVRTALIFDQAGVASAPFDYVLDQALEKWNDPPIRVNQIASPVIPNNDSRLTTLAHTSPGMMLQFAIAGLLTAAQIIVKERRYGVLARLLTTATRREHILAGHYLAIFVLVFGQFVALLSFAQLILRVNYLRLPLATLLVAFSAALCIAALGLLIGVLARNEEQAVTFALVPMFVFAGMGGAWMPLEATSATFQVIGHLTPLAWAMDGFKNITLRGLGVSSVLLPSAALVVYAALFFTVTALRFRRLQAD